MMKTATNQFNIYKQPRLNKPSLIISWLTYDIASVGKEIVQYLKNTLDMEEIGEINPLTFSTFEGAVFKDNIIQVPKSKFWASEEKNLVLLETDEPFYDRFNFLNLLLDISVDNFQAENIYTVSAKPEVMAHTHPRRIFTVFSHPELKEEFRGYHKLNDLTWKGSPAISTYLLWTAAKRELSGISLWPEVPFYMAVTEDLLAVKETLNFFSQRFNLELELDDLDERIQYKNEMLARLKNEDTEFGDLITRLEGGYTLDENEQMEITKKVYDFIIKPA